MDSIHIVLSQLIPASFKLQIFSNQFHKVAVVLWRPHPHVTGLEIKWVPLEIVDTPPVVGVFLKSLNLVFWSFEHICGVCSARVPNNWLDAHVAKDTVSEISVRVAFAEVNVSESYFGIPHAQVVLLPKNIHIAILFYMQPCQPWIKPSASYPQVNFERLADLVHLNTIIWGSLIHRANGPLPPHFSPGAAWPCSVRGLAAIK